MPRTSRAVAQRLGTQQKSRRRRVPKSAPQTPASVERILDEVAPLSPGATSAALATTALEPARPATRLTPAGARRGLGLAARPAPTRRRYSEYAAEYAYVGADLRRIVVVAGILVLLLVAIWLFIG